MSLSLGWCRAADGNLDGTTNGGGAYGYGTVFKINLSGALTTLHSFDNSEFPYAGLVQGADGNLYGTTSGGGAYGYGTVFKITPSGMLTTLYSFCPAGFPCADGADPFAGLVQATDGNFYGTTFFGGTGGACSTGCGTIFAITAGGTLTTVHSFDITDGSGPDAPLVQATDGNLYGTTPSGGAYGPGTVFRLVPPVFTTTVLTSAPNPSNLGQPVTMTATVTAQNGSTPTGTVVFKSNGVQIGSVSLNDSGVAVLIYAGLPLGIDSLTAVYQGSATLAGSTSNIVMQVAGATMTTVTSSPNPYHVRRSGDYNRDDKSGGAAGSAGADRDGELHIERRCDSRLHRSAAGFVADGGMHDFNPASGDGYDRGDLLGRYQLFR